MFDYLIQNGTLIDGTGAPAAAADVAIKDGKIAAVGDLKDASAGTVLDAAGKYVTPGFIDIHRHADAALFRPHFGELELKQGLTTIVNGNCGLSVTPCVGAYKKEIEAYLTPVAGALPENADFSSLASYLCAAKKTPSPINTAMLAGSGTIRACAAGFGTPELDAAQMRSAFRWASATRRTASIRPKRSSKRFSRLKIPAFPSQSICGRKAAAWSTRSAK